MTEIVSSRWRAGSVSILRPNSFIRSDFGPMVDNEISRNSCRPSPGAAHRSGQGMKQIVFLLLLFVAACSDTNPQPSPYNIPVAAIGTWVDFGTALEFATGRFVVRSHKPVAMQRLTDPGRRPFGHNDFQAIIREA